MGRKSLVTGIVTLVAAIGFGTGPAAGAEGDAGSSAKGKEMLRVVVLGLPGQGKPMVTASRISYPGGSSYRRFLTQQQYGQQFGATPRVRRKVLSLKKLRGVRQVDLNPTGTAAIVVMTPAAATRLFCAGKKTPGRPCRPNGFKWAIRQVSVGEVYPNGPTPKPPKASSSASGTPKGCAAAIKSKALTPNQISTAYRVDELRDRGLDGSGIRVATLSGQVVGLSDFRTWAKCFNQPAPKVSQPGMPSGVYDTQSGPDETVLDVEALSFLAPKLERILPI